ncbi:MAG: hypothetical protein SGJ27_09255 [Candidatus Melainabacteria bacterium]|nr:hypothetical protein [Candidatus Melainabacteria bacterium]
MLNHLKAGELYAFATNDGSCLVGKVLQSDRNSLDIYMYDRLFEPLSAKAEVVAALIEHKATEGYSTRISRREFALMYPLWLTQQEIAEGESVSGSQSNITIHGRPVRFHRSRPYWEPVIIFVFTWLMVLVFSLAVCVPDQPELWPALIVALLFSVSIALPLGGTIAIMSVVFRWLEARRTGFPIRTNPTIEFSLPMPLSDAFRLCRDRLGSKTNREFDFVDRQSGYIQARLNKNMLVRIMCYQLDTDKTGVITSCFDLKGGTFGADMWTLKNVVATVLAAEGADVVEQGPLAIGGIMRKVFWFVMTGVFACLHLMFLKATVLGETSCIPLLMLTGLLTAVAGIRLFRQAQEAA